MPRNWKSVALLVGNQIKAKEDHLMRIYFDVVFSGSAKFTHYTTANCKRKVTDIFPFAYVDLHFLCNMMHSSDA